MAVLAALWRSMSAGAGAALMSRVRQSLAAGQRRDKETGAKNRQYREYASRFGRQFIHVF